MPDQEMDTSLAKPHIPDYARAAPRAGVPYLAIAVIVLFTLQLPWMGFVGLASWSMYGTTRPPEKSVVGTVACLSVPIACLALTVWWCFRAKRPRSRIVSLIVLTLQGAFVAVLLLIFGWSRIDGT